MLSTTSTDGAIILISISGGPVTAVQPAESTYQLATSPWSGGAIKVLIRGPLTTGILARIGVPDRDLAASYSATVEQVAAQQRYEQQLPGEYTVSLVRP